MDSVLFSIYGESLCPVINVQLTINAFDRKSTLEDIAIRLHPSMASLTWSPEEMRGI